MKHKILIVDDDLMLLKYMKENLETRGYQVSAATTGEQAIESVAANPFLYSLVILDHGLPGKSGVQTTYDLLAVNPNIFIIIYSGQTSIPLKHGNVEMLRKGDAPQVLFAAVDAWCNKFAETRRTLSSDELPDNHVSMIENARKIRSIGLQGRSPAMAAIADTILREEKQKYADDALITGETGTGKQEIARALHRHSSRKDKPFITVDCGAIPAELIESELFGHTKGSFTGAVKDRSGHFRDAEGGTIFLDEIGDATPELQIKLLHVLQEREIKPVGTTDYVPVDVRIIAATHVDLEKAVAEGRFREDLYYRLTQLCIAVPPLRERPEDIAPLIAHFTEQYNRSHNRNKRFLIQTVRKLELHAWSGNIRQLEAKVRQYLKGTDANTVTVEDIEGQFFAGSSTLEGEIKLLKRRHEQEERELYEKVRLICSSLRDAEAKTGLATSTIGSTFRRLGIPSKFEGKYVGFKGVAK